MNDQLKDKRGCADPKRRSFDVPFRDEAKFLKTWFDRPLLTGAVSPSGRMLAEKMASYVKIDGSAPVIELGPGTGPVTLALLEHGISPERLVLVEFNPQFCALLRARFPQLRVIEGDAYNLRATLAAEGIDEVSAIVSSLPLLTRPEGERLRLLGDAFGLMVDDGVFVQFTYSFNSPIPLSVDDAPIPGIVAGVSPVIWYNLPPARVWTYRSSGFAFNPDLTFPRQSLVDLMRKNTEKWREDRHIKPAIAFLKRIGDHFDYKKPPLP